MSERIRLVDVRETPLSIDEVFAAVADPAAGGVCVFVGTVRDHDSGQQVEHLGYSSHPTAVERLREVAERAASSDDVVAVGAVHRTGDLAIGDLAVVVAVSAGHRPAAFAVCRQLIDELKEQVPIWKHQQYATGEAAWL